MEQTIWMTGGAAHELKADLHGLHVVVCPGPEGEARFLVFKQAHKNAQPALVQSGHCESVQQAMAAAEDAAQ